MIDEKELPEGWKIVQLGNLCKPKEGLRRGPFGSAIKKEFFVPDGYKVYEQSNAIYDDSKRGKYFIDEAKYNELINFNIVPGDLIVSCSGTLGKIAEIPANSKPGIINQALLRIRLLDDVILKKYFLYFFRSASFQRKIFDQSQGTAMSNLIGIKDFKLIELSIPLISEQQRIVDKIEELFSELDKGIENLKTAQQQLKVYRQAVLKWAFEGRLTNDNIKEGELPKGWQWLKLKDVCNKIQDGSHFSPQIQYDEPGENRFMYITAKNIRNNYMDFRKLLYVDKDYHNSIYARCNPEYGDVLLTKDGVNTGEVTLNTLYEPFSLLSSVCLFKPQKDLLKSELLKYFIQSPLGSQVILNSMTGTAIKRIILRKIRDAKISIPPITEQSLLVQEIESRLSACDKIEETITNSLQQAEVLRQSILKKAFEGKLVKVDAPKQEAKVIPINATRDVWERKVLAGKIIFACHKDRSFGTTKFQKLLFLCEHYVQLEFDTHYVKQTAGPLDAEFIYPFIREAEKNNWFLQDTTTAPFHFEPLIGIGNLTTEYPKFFKPVADKVNFVLNLFKSKNTDESELAATIYAIWNNYIIQKKELTAKVLPGEVYDWAESKAKFTIPQILAMWKWMNEVDLVPTGFGSLILHNHGI